MSPRLAHSRRNLARKEAASYGSRAGQSLIESCLVMAVICLAFFGVFQISQLYTAQDVLDYAAARGARAKTVGFNRFMVYKTIRVGAIPNAGRLLAPAHLGGALGELTAETPRIPLYLGSRNWGELDSILKYDAWDSVGIGMPSTMDNGNVLGMEVPQDMPFMSNAFHRAYYSGDSVSLRGEAYIDNHYSLYMEEKFW